MGLALNYSEGQTPIDEDEKEGLKIPTIATKGELDEFEQHNIEEAMLWLHGRNLRREKIISESFNMLLHEKMFGEVWDWAGKYRLTNKNIGVDKWQIQSEVKKLLDDLVFWIDHQSFSEDEIAIRHKHRLVSIHCFSNGNGRHSRLMADIISEKIFGNQVFSWGESKISASGELRRKYLEALRKADQGQYHDLIAFARS